MRNEKNSLLRSTCLDFRNSWQQKQACVCGCVRLIRDVPALPVGGGLLAASLTPEDEECYK